MPIPFTKGDRVTVVVNSGGNPVSTDTVVISNNDDHCWLDGAGSNKTFCRLTGAVVDKEPGVYIAIHSTFEGVEHAKETKK